MALSRAAASAITMSGSRSPARSACSAAAAPAGKCGLMHALDHGAEQRFL